MKQRLSSFTIIALSIAAAVATFAHHGQDAAADEEKAVIIELNNPKRALYPIAVPRGVGGDAALAQEVEEIARFDLTVAGWFKLVDPKLFQSDLNAEGLGVDVTAWKNVGAYGVIKYRITRQGGGMVLDARLYEIGKGAKPVLEKTYRGDSARNLTHRMCNDVVEYYTGEPGFFGSKIAFVGKRKGRKAVMAVGFDGHGAYALTRNRSDNILPAFSPSGGKVAFTSYMRNNPDLYIVGVGGGRPKRISKQPGMNTGASFSPDGSKIALTLSKDGNPEIYVISASDGRIIRRLTSNAAIDTSPAWSPDGSQIAFVSDRQGGPQIFVMNADGSNERRVSKNGNYNTTPVWSPRKDVRMLAYTTRDDGKFDIVTLDVDTGAMVRITQGQGNNEEPTFAPNGRAIAFASVRRGGAGIYIANADGTGAQHLVYKGYATSLDWGPAPK